MKRYYECHITINPGLLYAVKDEVEALGWTFSEINGDPDLGPGLKCYATKHFNARRTCEGVIEELEDTAAKLSARGCDVRRKKVEFVMYDNRVKP